MKKIWIFFVWGALYAQHCQVTISTAADTGGIVFSGGNYTFPGLSSANINTTTLQTHLSSGPVTIDASASGASSSAGSISVENSITGSSNNLTLTASDVGSTIAIAAAIAMGSGSIAINDNVSGIPTGHVDITLAKTGTLVQLSCTPNSGATISISGQTLTLSDALIYNIGNPVAVALDQSLTIDSIDIASSIFGETVSVDGLNANSALQIVINSQ